MGLLDRIVLLLRKEDRLMDVREIADTLKTEHVEVLKVVNERPRDLIDLVTVKNGEIYTPKYRINSKAK